MPPFVTPLGSRARFGLSLMLGLALLSCGGNPTSAPGQGAANLPPQTNPGVKSDDANKGKNDGPKRALKGTVLDAVTGEPIGKVTLYIEGVVTTIATTPIPSAPAPGADDKPGAVPNGTTPGNTTPNNTTPGGTNPGGGGAPLLLGALGDAGASAASSPGPGPSLLPGVSPIPGVSPVASAPAGFGGVLPSASPGLAGASPIPSTPANGTLPSSGSAAGASASPGSLGMAPGPVGSPYPLTPLTPDSKGKFELKDIPEGSYSITAYAPGYEAQTFQGNLTEDLDVKLRPLDIPKHDLHDLKGVVRQANNQPAGNVEIEVSSLLGRFPGEHVNSDDAGTFTLDSLVSGNYALAGWTSNLEGEITTFAVVKEVPVSLGKEKRTVSPTLVLRAVTDPVLIAGQVGVSPTGTAGAPADKAASPKPNAFKANSVRAFIQVGDGEIPLATATCGEDGYYRLKLPGLPEGATYHLVASGQNDAGQTVYVHKYDVAVANPKLDIPLPEAPTGVDVTDHSRSPAFSWEPMGGDVVAYRVALETIGQTGDTVWEGWTTGTAIRLPNNKDFKLLHDGESYRYTLTAIRLPEKGKLELTSLNAQPWDSSGATKPATFEVGKLKPGQKAGADTHQPLAVPEGTSPRSSASPSSKPSAKPSKKPKDGKGTKALPSPTSKRIKPITDL